MLALLVPPFAGGGADQAPSVTRAPAPPTSGAIPVAQVATRAAEVPALLRALTGPLAPSVEIEAIQRHLPELRAQIDLDLPGVARILRDQPTLDVLQAHQQMWQRRQILSTAWLNVLTQRATLLQDALDRLAEIRETWRRTRDETKASKAPGPILLQIDGVLSAIDAAEAPLRAQRTAVLDLQSAVAPELARSQATLARFNEAQQRAMGGILAQDSPPIWDAHVWARARTVLPARLREVAATRWANIVRYASDPSGRTPLHVAVVGVLAILLVAARRRVRQWAASGEGSSPATAVFEYPYSTTVVIGLLIVASPYAPIPPTVRVLFVVLGLAAAIRLTRRWADPRLAPELYMLWVLFAVDSLREALAGVLGIEQVILVLEMLAGIAGITYSLRVGGLRRFSTEGPDTGRLSAVRVGARLVLLTFAVALVAAALGYMRLARLLASGVLGSGALALTLYAAVRVVVGMAAFALRVWPLGLLQMVQHHRGLLERRTHHVLVWAAMIGWIARTLDHVGLFQPAMSFGQAVLDAKLGRGSIQITLRDMLEFVLTVWLAYLVSTFVRFVLREDVYPHTRLTRGISYAISSLLNYMIVTLGFVLALGALGLDLTKVTVLAGAFGVGIGFGLQSVVNNFVSGLILLFERPVHVGDIVEVGNISGEVSRIGIRASTLRTWQGAEVIVPNAQLVTEQVTNWTLSDRTRRIDLPVGVDYGSAPDKVVDVLEAVARAHPQIMPTPPPHAVFKSFGDSSINFELRAWTSRFERWPVIQTELAAAIYAALHAAGMSLPFPQREVRLLHDDAAGGPDTVSGTRAREADEAPG
jgi:small-conductance mechanosensitive channel